MANNSFLDKEGFILHSPFGTDRFGEWAERFARFFGTPKFLIGQSVFVMIWIIFNCLQKLSFDPYPFILLNLAFSTQAAYAAPLILLSQTRQAERDKLWEKSDADHREELHLSILEHQKHSNEISQQILELTKNVNFLMSETHKLVVVSKRVPKKRPLKKTS
jgi:uncharacterized membrane protein